MRKSARGDSIRRSDRGYLPERDCSPHSPSAFHRARRQWPTVVSIFGRESDTWRNAGAITGQRAIVSRARSMKALSAKPREAAGRSRVNRMAISRSNPDRAENTSSAIECLGNVNYF